MKKYFPKDVESKWQEKWQKSGIYDFSFDAPGEPFYDLVELPYPSGDLHLGHWFAFVPPDAYARFMKMKGFNVLFPMGFDAFGLPAENAAMKRGNHPKDWTLSNIETMTKQFASMGTMLAWNKEVITCEPKYYRWNQWIFLKLYEKGLAYRGKALSNWCPVDQTVLANENIESGKCWRCGSEVIQKEIEQWFLKITDYADKLIWPAPPAPSASLRAERGEPEKPEVNWPNSVRVGQNNWIGKKEGIDITYKIEGSDEQVTVFTTRPDTNFGATFIALAPEHELVSKITKPEQKEAVESYVKEAGKKTQLERQEEKQKTGAFTGSFAINELTGYKMPIWVSDFVLLGFGTGALVGVPAHDMRDFEFAKKFDLKIKRVVVGKDCDTSEITKAEQVQEEAGVMVNSDFLDGLDIHEATQKIMDYMEEKGYGKRMFNYHLHDWSISRQRYWGTPVPMIYCDSCGTVPVAEKDLPIELPYDVDFTPHGKPPLASNEEWLKVSCPRCGGEAKRDAETLDTFFDSSWYFFRYLDPDYAEGPLNPDLAAKIMPVDIYFGGAEHTLGHTLYARFFTKFFKDLGLINFDEFALRRVQHGVVLGPDGNRMSKSKGNVVNPDELVSEYGTDTVRLYLSFMMPYIETTAPFAPGAIAGIYRFLRRIWDLSEKSATDGVQPSEEDLHWMNKTIKKVSDDLSEIKFNTTIASMMEWLNFLSSKKEISKQEYSTLILLLAPFAPHISEELWEFLGNKESVHLQSWPAVEEKYLQDTTLEVAVQINGKLRDVLQVSASDADSSSKMEELALESPKVIKFLEGKNPKKIIYVKGKILSIVV